MLDKYINNIKDKLRENAPTFSQDEILRRYRILNSTNPNFRSYGLKMAVIENIVKQVHGKYDCSYDEAVKVFNKLISSDIHDENFAAILFLNRFKKFFDESTLKLIFDKFSLYCDTWALCDSTMIKIVGPFLGKKGNEKLAENTIERWSNSDNMWIRRASMVILLKLTMMRKDFNEILVFNLVDKMLSYPEEYIQKGIGWLLKTCSSYKPDVVIKYLNKNKKRLTRLILRYATEKLPEDIRAEILKKV
ncbi:MAG: DNA alkylation repair protein [Promethearchaeota archaeon]